MSQINAQLMTTRHYISTRHVDYLTTGNDSLISSKERAALDLFMSDKVLHSVLPQVLLMTADIEDDDNNDVCHEVIFTHSREQFTLNL